MKQVRRQKNQAEQAFIDFSRSQNWEVTKRGWPDFICYDDKIFCVEVKPRTKQLKVSQRRVMKWLSSYGIQCHRWDPQNGFTDWKYIPAKATKGR